MHVQHARVAASRAGRAPQAVSSEPPVEAAVVGDGTLPAPGAAAEENCDEPEDSQTERAHASTEQSTVQRRLKQLTRAEETSKSQAEAKTAAATTAAKSITSSITATAITTAEIDKAEAETPQEAE